MKATSKLISVVLILAMCLSMFTVSAFADGGVVIGETIPVSGIPAANSWVGANRGQQATIAGNTYVSPAAVEEAVPAEATAAQSTAETVNTVPSIVTVSTAEELQRAVANGGEIKLANDISLSAPLAFGAGATLDLNGKVLSFANDMSAQGMAISSAAAVTIKNGTVSVKGDVKNVNNSAVEVGFGSVASGVTLNNVNVRFYAPADWTMFGTGVGLVYGTYNRDVSAYFSGNDKLAVVEQNGVYVVKDKTAVEEPAAAAPVQEVAEEAAPAAEAVQEEVAPAAESETAEEAVPVETAEETQAAETAEEATQEADVEVENADAETPAEDQQSEEPAAEGESAEDAETPAEEGEQTEENTAADAEGEDAAVEGEDAADAEAEQNEGEIPASDEQLADENAADVPVDETPVNVVEEEEKVYEEEVRVAEEEEANEDGLVTLTGTDEVTGAVVIITGKNLPEGLTVVVKPLSADVIGGLGEGERAVLALDISLVDAEGNEYEPKDDPNVGAVSVQIKHPSLGNLEEDENLTLYHVVDDVTQTVGSAAQSAEDTLDFATGSFSPFIIIASSGNGTAKTGSEGEAHKRSIKITNIVGDVFVKGITAQPLIFKVDGGVVPESVSVVDPDYVSSGNAEIFKAGYMLYSDKTLSTANTDKLDYVVSSKPDGSAPIDLSDPLNITDPYYIVFTNYSLQNAPTGKWAFVFWFRDTTDTGSTRVYMVQYVTIVPAEDIKPILGEGGNGLTEDGFGGYYFNKCSYSPMEFYMTAELNYLSITDIATGIVRAEYTWPDKFVTVRDANGANPKQYSFSEMLEQSDYSTYDPVTHQYIAGKSLKILSNLIRKLDFKDYYVYVEQLNHDMYGSSKYYTTTPFGFGIPVTLQPGITVADGLNDYIKGKNVWIKFEACWPIDYDADGTLAIWIGGQKITHDYYSISNDHKTLWIYRNLLDQLRSNNSYTLTARLWRYDSSGNKQTFYPASAQFNILAAGSTSYKSPKTGDNSNIALWAAVLVLSGGAVVALIPKKKKVKISK